MNLIKEQLIPWLQQQQFTDIILLTDHKIQSLYPDYFLPLSQKYELHTFYIPEGEKSKDLTTCNNLWNNLLNISADRNSLLINWGGGSVSDVGGFVAACYKRGIRYINIPTTLLAMIDAAYGGKTGIDLCGVKNAVGHIHLPMEVFVDPSFLLTLDTEQLKSGFGELIKYALICDINLWNELLNIKQVTADHIPQEWLFRCRKIKQMITHQDPFDHDLRRLLNFGHTIGHALESHYIATKHPITHGHAVALGMLCECHISWQRLHIQQSQLNEIAQLITRLYPLPTLHENDIASLISFCYNDKKNCAGNINICLLANIGLATPNNEASTDEIIASLHYLIHLYK